MKRRHKVFLWGEFWDTPKKAWIVVGERMAWLTGDRRGTSRYILNNSDAFLSPWIWTK